MEALANINQFGLCELNENELMEVDGGGWPWEEFAAGAATVAAAIGIAAAVSAVAATAPVSIPVALATIAITSTMSAGGGYMMGDSFNH